LYNDKFCNIVKNVSNPYGNGGTSTKIVEVLRKYDMGDLLKKCFYDIQSMER